MKATRRKEQGHARRQSQIVLGLLALAAVVFDLAYYGSPWAPPQ